MPEASTGLGEDGHAVVVDRQESAVDLGGAMAALAVDADLALDEHAEDGGWPGNDAELPSMERALTWLALAPRPCGPRRRVRHCSWLTCSSGAKGLV